MADSWTEPLAPLEHGGSMFARLRVSPTTRPDHIAFTAHLDSCPACHAAYTLCPLEFHETSFRNFDTSTAERAAMLASAREFAAQVRAHDCGFAVFVGKTGPGKTRLACNIIRELKGPGALYLRQAELTAALRATYGPQHYEHDEDGRPIEPDHPLELTQRVQFLVLDEIGCTAPANDERQLLDELLKHRYEKRKPTILISNLPLDEFKQLLGDDTHNDHNNKNNKQQK